MQQKEMPALRFQGWIVFLTFWICFGTIILLNSFVFTYIIGDGTFTYPSSTRDTAYSIIAIWGTAYVVGIVTGLTANTPTVSIWHVISSVVLGYLFAITLYVMILGPFPNIPTDSFGVLRDLVSIEPLPVYYVFILMSLVFGPILIGVATYTGYLVANEYLQLKLKAVPNLQPITIIFATIAPLSIALMLIGGLNVCDIEDGLSNLSDICSYEDEQALLRSYQRQVRNVNQTLPYNEQETVPTILIFHLDLLVNPLFHAFLALFIGGIIGLKRNASPTVHAFNAAIGTMIYITLALILNEIFKPSTGGYIDYSLVYQDRLGDLAHPNAIVFMTLWSIPPIVAGASAFAVSTLRTQRATHEIATTQ